ncbi:hypothetical protein MS3_00004350 [Schistosoma haematobium]|uniref:Leucine-rich repeat-containing protein n=1 Tax=Schistosoma haematobium TaxID=6185 RepID=A0A922S400_SCHHA|nr:hypothetical protein MS3_00004350 [Schistosoma haematobium]KAH9592414.1 hypothetical protein MS3_00004350 [Schistosoma haematobium]CAH8677257.1 unnamed protein product [Schistosoma haematobium]
MLDSLVVPNKSNDALKNDANNRDSIFCDYYSNRQESFSNRRLRDFSNISETLRFVEHLDLSRNFITNIPSGIEQYRLLTTLDLSFNKIFSVPNSLCKLPSLRILLMSNNYLSSLPANICELQNLQELDLSFNRFKHFPSSICSLHSLKVLLLGCNLIETLPEDIVGLRCLKILDLHSNGVKQLPLSIRFMWCLERLSLEENPLSPPLLTIVARGIPYIFAFLNQQALCNSNNTSCEKFHDSLTQSSSAQVTNTSNQQNMMKLSESQDVNSNSSSPCFERTEVNTDSDQRYISKSEITNPSLTIQNFTYSTTNNKNEQFDKPNTKLHSNDYNCIENFSHNVSTQSCINETLKSGSSFSSLSTDDNESLTMNMYSSAYENVILDKNENEVFYLPSNISQQLTQTINNSQVAQPISPGNDNTKKAIVSTVLNGNDSAVESSVVQTVSSYIIRNETPCNVCEPTKNGQIKDCPTNHSSFKYDRRDKGGPISSHTRLRYSKRQQIEHDRNVHSSSGYITPDSYLSENCNRSQTNGYHSQNFNQYHSDKKLINQRNHTQLLYHPHKNSLYNEDISNKITHVGVALCMPSECTLKLPKNFQTSHNYQPQTNTHCQDSSITFSTDYLSEDVSRKSEIRNIDTLKYMKMNSHKDTVKWEELNSDDLIRINQLRTIIDKELNIRLPINPKHLIIELSTGVILIQLLNKFIGTTSTIKLLTAKQTSIV